MRIIQIIDSLDIGGAEKMAVSFANSLSSRMEFSGLVVTRKEGSLKKSIKDDVNYFFLRRKHRFDFWAVMRLRNYCKKNDVRTIQAHSSSFFIACMVKMIYPKIQILWHDHNGIGVIPKREGAIYLQFFSFFFKGIIAVNTELEAWARRKLFCKNIIYLQNYVVEKNDFDKTTLLKGEDGKRVLYLANLRHQKNHFLLVDVVKKVHNDFKDWTFHIVGNDSNNDYSTRLKAKIKEYNLENVIYIYGSKQDTEHIINQCDIAVFTSNSEGLPVALLEYGLFCKPVVSTSVGQIPYIVQHGKCGFISKIGDSEAFSVNLSTLMADKELRLKFGKEIHKVILETYSEQVVIDKYFSWILDLKNIKIN
ncbi:glycosyltransferase [Flavobacterium sp.]|uniref:glycosyltransferase n=1 Tax=Flavobacterium sp. TaxID=239 RepID=UPI00262BDC91|nr:glycosyltransferase [Flavobacterium sp.]